MSSGAHDYLEHAHNGGLVGRRVLVVQEENVDFFGDGDGPRRERLHDGGLATSVRAQEAVPANRQQGESSMLTMKMFLTRRWKRKVEETAPGAAKLYSYCPSATVPLLLDLHQYSKVKLPKKNGEVLCSPVAVVEHHVTVFDQVFA
jgi:hypothetical protein